MIILLDGGKGAGKSTVVQGLEGMVKNAEFFSLDIFREQFTDGKTTNENNAFAYEKMFEAINSSLIKGKIVIIDSGMTRERIAEITLIAEQSKSILKKIHLHAPKEVLWNRVMARHKMRNKSYPANRERFDYTYRVLMDKDFSDFVLISTDKNDAKEVLKKVLDEIPMNFK